MGKLKLTVNEDKTRICKVPEGEFALVLRPLRQRPFRSHLARCDQRRRIVRRPAISLSLRFLWRAQNAIYHGSGYSKSAGDVRSLNSCPERRANEICCSFGNLLNPSDLVIADG